MAYELDVILSIVCSHTQCTSSTHLVHSWNMVQVYTIHENTYLLYIIYTQTHTHSTIIYYIVYYIIYCISLLTDTHTHTYTCTFIVILGVMRNCLQYLLNNTFDLYYFYLIYNPLMRISYLMRVRACVH